MAVVDNKKIGGRHRKVSFEMFADEKFLELSPLKPSGQALWLYLLTGPFSTLIPGIVVGGKAGIAERLGWSPTDFLRCFEEIASRRMAVADWGRQVIFLPNALKHNAPQNPNVVLGWAQAWAEVPACTLKHQAAARIRQTLAQMGTQYVQAFDTIAGHSGPDSTNDWGNDSSKHSSNHSPADSRNQPPNQEQEQEQEQDPPPLPPSLPLGDSVASKDASRGSEIDLFVACWNAAAGAVSPPLTRVQEVTPERRRKARARLKERSLAQWERIIARVMASNFCRGLVPPNGRRTEPWTASFDWLIDKPDNAVKVLEGTYDNRHGASDGDRAPVSSVEETSAYLQTLKEPR
jgi:hypothetical protein